MTILGNQRKVLEKANWRRVDSRKIERRKELNTRLECLPSEDMVCITMGCWGCCPPPWGEDKQQEDRLASPKSTMPARSLQSQPVIRWRAMEAMLQME